MRRFGVAWGRREFGVFGLLVMSSMLWSIGVVSNHEVYPAPVLPSFGGVPEQDRSEPASWEVLLTTPGDDHLVALTAEDLFPDVPDSQWHNLFTSTLANASSVDVTAWIVGQAEAAADVGCSTEIVVREVTVSGEVTKQSEVFNGSCH